MEDTFDLSSIGAVIRRERKAHGLTQAQLGTHAGTGLNFISQLERGKSTVRLDKLLEVLRVLGLELQLIRGKGAVSVAQDLTPATRSAPR